jgi:hypothetical protein
MHRYVAVTASGLFVLYNAVVYLDGQLSSGQSLHYIPSDYRQMMQNTATGLAVLGHALSLLPYVLSEANTYIRKAVRYHSGREVQLMPEGLATAAAGGCAAVKALTSAVSDALKLAGWLIALAGGSEKSTTPASWVTKAVSMLAVLVATTPSTFLIQYAVGYNEAQGEKNPEPMASTFLSRKLRAISHLARPGVHSLIANTPSILMYALGGHGFVRFILRFIYQQSEEDYQPHWALMALSLLVNTAASATMELSYNVKYEQELGEFKAALPGSYRRMSDAEPVGGLSRYLRWQRDFVAAHPKAIKLGATIFKSMIMCFDAFKLTYMLSSDVAAYKAGQWDREALLWAGSMALMNNIVCLLATSAFLFERPEGVDAALPTSHQADDASVTAAKPAGQNR